MEKTFQNFQDEIKELQTTIQKSEDEIKKLQIIMFKSFPSMLDEHGISKKHLYI